MSKPVSWYFGAFKRTVRAALPWGVRPDDAWARQVLTGTEFQVYCTMPKAERFHGVSVAKCVKQRAGGASRELLAAAVLHDIGKVGTPQFWLYRVIAHLAPGEKQPFCEHATGLAAVRQALHHHPLRGAALLAEHGIDPTVVAFVKYHHEPPHTPEQHLLQRCDEEQ